MPNIKITANILLHLKLLQNFWALFFLHHEPPSPCVAQVHRPALLAHEIFGEHILRNILPPSINKWDVVFVPESVAVGVHVAHDVDKPSVPSQNSSGDIGSAAQFERLERRRFHPVLAKNYTDEKQFGQQLHIIGR